MMETFFTVLKETTTILKLLQLGEARIGEASSFGGKIKNERDFERYFLSREVKNISIPVLSISPEEISCALQLAYATGQVYLNDPRFTSLRLLADIKDEFGALPMDTYFVTPSYVDRDTYQRRETLLLEETRDPSQLGSSNNFNNFIPQDYISSSLFSDAKRVVVTGNPGVGKSTFSRWLCHAWATGKMSLSGIPLHIDLSQLRSGGDNNIVSYLKRNYAPKFGDDVIRQALKLLPQDFLYILDGFDELEGGAQRRLRQDLNDINAEARYILLSRPYGLIDNPGFVADFGLRIDGFTDSNIRTYVGAFLKKNGRYEERAAFIDLLQQNRVLRDYAHTPLLLSFMVYLFLADKRGFEQLQSVDSRYGLQHTVFGWLQEHEIKKIRVLPIPEIIKTAEEVAYELEIEQSVWVDLAGKGDHRKPASVELSKMGMGSLRTLSRGKERFSFITLTFQEYFAAEHIHERITPEAIALLADYRFFWNFTAMIFGGLGYKVRAQVISETLDGFNTRFVKSRSGTDWALYLIHLAEAPARVVETYSAGMRMDTYLNAYRFSFYNKDWQQSVLDAMSSIYAKLGLMGRRRIEEWLFKAIKELVGLGGKKEDRTGTPEVEYAKALIVQLRLHEDERLLRKYVGLQERVIEQRLLLADNEVGMQAFEGLSFIFDELMGPPEGFRSQALCQRLKALVDGPGMIDLFAMTRYRILSRLVDGGEAKQYLSGRLLQLEADIKVPTDEDGLIDWMKKCAGGVYLCGVHFDSGEDVEVDELLRRGTETIIKGLSQLSDPDDFDTGEIGTLAIEGVVKFDEPALYPAIFTLAGLTEVQMLNVRIPDTDRFFTYFGETMERVVAEDKLEELTAGIDLVADVRNQFGRVRERVGEALVGFVEKHYASFATYKDHDGADIVMDSDVPIAPLEKMSFFLHHIIFDPGLPAADRQYLANALSRFREVPFFKEYFFPAVWGDDFFQFFQQEYWDCLDVYHTPEGTGALLHILSNPTVYTFSANLPRIVAELRYLANFAVEDRISGNAHRVFRVCGYTLGMLRRIHREENQLATEAVDLVEQLIQDYHLLNLYQDPEVMRSLDGKSLLLLPFLYSFTERSDLLGVVNFDQVFSEKGIEYQNFLEGLIKGFVEAGRLDEGAFNHALEVLDEKTVGVAREKLSFKRHLVKPFNRQEFEDLLLP